MHLDKIKVSSRTTHSFGMLKSSTGIGPEPWAKIALCLSLKQKGIPNPDEYNTDGTEFHSSHLFGSDEKIYHALIVNRLIRDKLDPDVYMEAMTRAHINRGTISLKQRVNNLSDMYRFLDEMNVKSKNDGVST